MNPNPATLAGSGTVPLTVSVATAAATAQARIAPLGALLVAAPVVLALSGELPRVISAGLGPPVTLSKCQHPAGDRFAAWWLAYGISQNHSRIGPELAQLDSESALAIE